MKIYYKNLGIVIINGFSGIDIEPLTNKLKSLGYIVELPILKLNKSVTYKDWVKDIEETYLSIKEKCSNIILIGISIGGLLSLQIAKKFKVKSIITLNTPILRNKYRINFRTVNLKKLLKDTKKSLKDLKCKILVNQANSNNKLFRKSAKYLNSKVNSDYKKIMFYSKRDVLQNEMAEDVIIDLVKNIENIKL